MPTRQQNWAQIAYREVSNKKGSAVEEGYARVCKIFPALIHNSGLCQALAFAEAKDKGNGNEFGQYMNSLATMLGMNSEQLLGRSRDAEVLSYQRLTQDALSAASWLKRYAEALLRDESNNGAES